jgi:phosphatidylinositol glycan class Q protein
MLMSDGLLRVFWPYDLPRSSSQGVIVGWKNSELDLFVLTVLEDVEVSRRISWLRYGICWWDTNNGIRFLASKCRQRPPCRNPFPQ